MFSRAKSASGLWGNFKFIWRYKTWAALVTFLIGYIAGTFHWDWATLLIETLVAL